MCSTKRDIINDSNKYNNDVGDAFGCSRNSISPLMGPLQIAPTDRYATHYNMNHAKRGLALIFNHEFFTIAHLRSRCGTNEDCKNLINTLKNLGFEVNDFHNYTHRDIVKNLERVASMDHSQHDCLVVAILSHGDLGLLYAHDTSYKPDSIWAHFTADKCPTLSGKPKLFFIQACQGDKLDAGITLKERTETDGQPASTFRIPSHADFLIAYSTIPGILNPDNVWVSARTNKTLGFWNDLGAHATLKNGEVVDNCDIIFLAMKPHMFDDALKGIRETMTSKASHILFVSVLVGVTLDCLANKLKSIVTYPRIIRCMPNTPMMVGEGITVYCSMNTTNQDETIIEKLFSYIGVIENVPESLMNAIGGLSGSGPAYAYLVIEALADGAVKMGVPRPMATKFAAQVLVGAGKMVLETGRHPGQLKDEVCSPGGTTITGVHAMECGQVR